MNENEQATAGRMAMRDTHRINITLPEELYERATAFGAKQYIGSFSEIVRRALMLMMQKAKTDAAATEAE